MFTIYNSYLVDNEGSETINGIREALNNCNEYYNDEALFVFKTNEINFIMTARYNNENNFNIVRSRSYDEKVRFNFVFDSQMLYLIYPNEISKDNFISRISSLLVSLIYMHEVKYISIAVTNSALEAYNYYTSKTINMNGNIIIDAINNRKFERETISAVVVDQGTKFNGVQLRNFLEENNLDEQEYFNLFVEIGNVAEEQYVAVQETNTFTFDSVKASQEMGDFKGYIDSFNNIVIESTDMKMTQYDFKPSKYRSLRLL